MDMTDATIRRNNLHHAMRARSWGPAEMSRQLGRTPSFWTDVLAARKSFGEKLARNIEERLGLPRLALDDPAPTRAESGALALINPVAHIRPHTTSQHAGLHVVLTMMAARVQVMPEAQRDMLARMLDAWVRSGCDPVWLPPIESMLRDRQ
jgi:hypothetical protein